METRRSANVFQLCRNHRPYAPGGGAADGSVHIADPRPLPKSGTFLHPFARFIIPLESRKKITFGSQGREVEAVLEPGDAVFGRPGAWIDEHFELHHRMISVVFYEKFIRYLYIEQLDDSPRNGPDVYFHTLRPPSAAILGAVAAMSHMAPGARAAGCAFRALLTLCVDFLAEEDDRLFTEDDPNLEPPRRMAPAEVLP